MNTMDVDISPIIAFLGCETPEPWIKWALENPDLTLIDHAHCEKKAASSALNMLYRYVDRPELLLKLSQLAREELLHFEQVLKIMENRGVAYRHLSPSGYAAGLRQFVKAHEPDRLIDLLIVGSIIEARSCERFARLAEHVDDELARYYRYLLHSESRHYADYLELAKRYALSESDVEARIDFFLEQERELILSPDKDFRFHSGVPSGEGLLSDGS